MLKEREIALTLSSPSIMNAVSINVCIINHISTNWTNVEPVGLSDMETGLAFVCFHQTAKWCAASCVWVSFAGGVWEPGYTFALFFTFESEGGDCFGQILVRFHTGRLGK